MTATKGLGFRLGVLSRHGELVFVNTRLGESVLSTFLILWYIREAFFRHILSIQMPHPVPGGAQTRDGRGAQREDMALVISESGTSAQPVLVLQFLVSPKVSLLFQMS